MDDSKYHICPRDSIPPPRPEPSIVTYHEHATRPPLPLNLLRPRVTNQWPTPSLAASCYLPFLSSPHSTVWFTLFFQSLVFTLSITLPSSLKKRKQKQEKQKHVTQSSSGFLDFEFTQGASESSVLPCFSL